ncbi:hypothetical protein [Anaerosinus massiliensis]|uniref:hypothetical protein n=1 Tax=Massilibacillus massiliensis TaxID=1806837 RepID=UPI000DA60A9D|nr:hypothetical protein [Massilibacillus massiliensis]
MQKKVWLTFLTWIVFTMTALAASPEDFSYQGINLGDHYDTMVEKLGQPRTDFEHRINDRAITYYFYKGNELRIGLDQGSNQIVDIRVRDKDYTTKHGVKIGATSHKILKEYGSATKQRMNGHIYYIYKNDPNDNERLFLDVSQGYLEEFRITSLIDE